MVNGVVGFAGLPVTLAALQAGRRLALANKESLIAGGPVVQAARATPGAEIVPVDSEHCAIHQCLRAVLGEKEMAALPHPPVDAPPPAGADRQRRSFPGPPSTVAAEVTVADALAHPTWKMGPKITIDSSTLMNKGLEVIEAHELFGVGLRRHRGGGAPAVDRALDDRDHRRRHPGPAVAARTCACPIGYALAYPDRLGVPFGAIDWAGWDRSSSSRRTGSRSRASTWPTGPAGPAAPPRPWLNGANEVAVAAFLDGRIRWIDIAEIISAALDECLRRVPGTVADVLDADRVGPGPGPGRGGPAVERSAMTDTRPGWRESLEADPLGLASHRQWEEPPAPPPPEQRWRPPPPAR